MKQFINRLLKLYLLLQLSACSHSLYQGKLEVLNSDGKAQPAIVYWTKTEKLIGTGKAGPLMILTGCSTRRLSFVDSPAGIVFNSTTTKDEIPGQSAARRASLLCGKVNNAPHIIDLTAEPLLVSIYCSAQRDEMTMPDPVLSPAYIQARAEPYRFEIEEINHWSIFGDIPEAPQPPECR